MERAVLALQLFEGHVVTGLLFKEVDLIVVVLDAKRDPIVVVHFQVAQIDPVRVLVDFDYFQVLMVHLSLLFDQIKFDVMVAVRVR